MEPKKNPAAEGVAKALSQYTGGESAKSTATNLLKDIARGFASIGLSAGEAIPRIVSKKAGEAIIPATTIPGLSFLGPIQSVQSKQQAELKAGTSPTKAALKAGLDVAINEPLGIALKPLAFIGSMAFKRGAPAVYDEVVQNIANTEDVVKISDEVSKIVDADEKKLLEVSQQLSKANKVGDVKAVLARNGLTGIERQIPRSAAAGGQVSAGITDEASSFYQRETQKNVTEDAAKLIDNDINEAVRVAKSDVASSLSNETARQLVKKFDAQAMALKATDPIESQRLRQEAIDILDTLSKKATTQGQAISILRQWSNTSPEGILLKVRKTIDKANEALPVGSKKKIEFTPKLAEQFSERANEIAKLADGEEKVLQTAEMLRDIDALIPPSLMKKVSTLQTMFQLLNPKTFVRNVIGNLGFAGLENVTGVASSLFDSALTPFMGPRTISLPSISKQVQGLKSGFREGLKDAIRGVNTSSVKTQFDLSNAPVFKNKALAMAEKMLNVSLRATDRAAFQAAFENSLASQMKAKGIKDISQATDEMIEEATYDGLYKTFQDENATTQFFSGLKNVLNLGKEFGVGDIVLKYPKTPANLLNRGLAYTPAGYVNAVFELARPFIGKGPIRKKRFVEKLARATVGSSALFGIGATLNKIGVITESKIERSDEAAFKRELGLGEYRINVDGLKRYIFSGGDVDEAKLKKGDALVSFDWFQPVAMPLVMGADFNASKGSAVSALGAMLEAVQAGTETLANQPLISGLSRLFKGSPSKAIETIASNIPSSFVPTILRQVKSLLDNQQRMTYDPNPVKYTLNKVKASLPFASETLPQKYGMFGQALESYPEGTNNLFNVMFNPSFVTKYDPGTDQRMVLELLNRTDSVRAVPNYVQPKVSVNGENKELTPKQLQSMQYMVGTLTRELLSSYANDPRFQRLSDEEQIGEIGETLESIGKAAKIAILGDNPGKRPSKRLLSILSLLSQ